MAIPYFSILLYPGMVFPLAGERVFPKLGLNGTTCDHAAVPLISDTFSLLSAFRHVLVRWHELLLLSLLNVRRKLYYSSTRKLQHIEN